MENYYRFFKDEVSDEDSGDEDDEAVTAALREFIGDGTELKKLLLAASGSAMREGAEPEPEDEQDWEAPEYLAYALTGRDPFAADHLESQDVEA